METAGTGGIITINLYEYWQHYFARMWSDIGRLAASPIIDIHQKKLPWLGVACDCWACRALAASEAANS